MKLPDELILIEDGERVVFMRQRIREEARPAAQTNASSMPPRDVIAKSMADLVTPKQLGMIRFLAREAVVDPDEECQKVLRCNTDELSKRAASSLIDHLKTLQSEKATA